MATVHTYNGPKHFIDLSNKEARCIGINIDVNNQWDVEPHIIRLNPNCKLFAFGATDKSRQLVEETKNSAFEMAIPVYDERINNEQDSNRGFLLTTHS